MKLGRLGIWAFLVTIAYVPAVMSSAVVGRWIVIALGVPFVAEIRLKVHPGIQIALAMGMSWACVSLLIAPDTLDSLLQLYFMALLVLVMGVASQQDDIDQMMVGMLAGIGVNVLVCLPILFWHAIASQMGNTYAGLFYNSEVFTELCAPLAVWAIVKRRWFLAVLPMLPILANHSRVAAIAVIFSLFCAFWPKTWRRRGIAVGVAVALIGGVAVYLTLDTAKFSSGALRIAIWGATALSITPLGHGLGAFRATYPVQFEFAHSDALQALSELGIGALCFAVIPIVALRNRRDHAEWAAFIAVCVELVVSFPLHVPANAFLAAVLAGYLVRDRARVLVLRPDGGTGDGRDNEWHSAIRGDTGWRGRRSRVVVPVGSTAEGLQAMGSCRSCAEAS